MFAKKTISKLLLLAAVSSISLVAAAACGAEEAEEPEAPAQPVAGRAADEAAAPAAPQAPTGRTGAAQAAAEPDAASGTVGKAQAPAQPKAGEAAQAAADPEKPKAAAAAEGAMTKTTTRTGGAVDLNLADEQVLNLPGRLRSGAAPWRDGGSNRSFSMAVFGTLFQLSPKNDVVPWIASGWTVNDGLDVFTVTLRDDAVFQDGTPITAADVKAYWEHGAKPENIIAWGGASLTIGEIKGWDELKAGDVTEAEGLVAVNDQTLEITLSLPFPTWPFAMSAWHTGVSKLDQVKSDENWWQYPVSAGPFSMTIDPDSGLTVVSSGAQWWGDDSILEKMVLEAIPDRQVQVIMFENGELDMMTLDGPTYGAALDPSHPFNPLLKTTPGGGLGGYFIAHVGRPPLEDLFVRKALAAAVDMRTILTAVRGPTVQMATGLISPTINCHDPDAPGQVYDPDLARQFLSESSYGSASNLPVLKTDLANPQMINIGVAMKEYWKDNLDAELDIVRRERGIGRRPDSQWGRHSAGAWIPDPVQIVSTMTVKDIGELDDAPGVYDVMDALEAYARTLPLDHPDRCAAFQAVGREYIDQVYMIPHQWILGHNWVVQPWVRGFDSTFNLEVNVWEIFIQKH
jgi:ABC-type transport system substrate-binding protein